MATEKNRTTLDRALAELRVLEAPEHNWPAIAGRLDEADDFDRLTLAARQLPVRKAPEHNWPAIAARLEAPVRPMRPWWTKPAAGWAAAVALAVTMAWLFGPDTTSTEVMITVRTETVDPHLLGNDWETDEAAIAEVVNLYQQQHPVFRIDEGRDWLSELAELNAARLELLEAMEQFGRDAVLLKELADIERDRSQILQEMAQRI